MMAYAKKQTRGCVDLARAAVLLIGDWSRFKAGIFWFSTGSWSLRSAPLFRVFVVFLVVFLFLLFVFVVIIVP